MSKLQTKFVCQDCGAQYARWVGRCNECGNWNTIIEEVVETRPGKKVAQARPEKVIDIGELEGSAISRIPTTISEFDQVLGGGIVPGSLILLGGDPGIGKSTLILQIASKLKGTLYISGEESEKQIQMRAGRLGIKSGIMLLSETNLEKAIATIQEFSPTIAIIDSIQTMYSDEIPGVSGSVSQLSLCASRLMNLAKQNHIAVILIGHVTKEGNIAGPRVLEHLVDVVLYLEGDRYGSFRVLRGVKNRFGSTNEAGIFEMKETGLLEVKNPSELMISERAHKSPGTTIFPAMEGTRPLLVEVQSLNTPTSFGYPKRTSSGFDLNRLNLLAAVLQKRCNLNFSTQDVFLNIAGGISVKEPGADLAVCLSLASGYKGKMFPEDTVIFGEVGLAGEVRKVNNTEKRLSEAAKIGFKKAIIAGTRDSAPRIKGLNILTVSTVKEAIEKAL